MIATAVAHFAPLAVCYPEQGYEADAARRGIPDGVPARVHAVFAAGHRASPSLPDTWFFNYGSPNIATLLRLVRIIRMRPCPTPKLGDRFGVSRTHVRKLLVAAEQAGLVKLHARGGHRVEILPRLWSSYDRGLATGMYVHDMTYVVTMKHWVPARTVRQRRAGAKNGAHRA